jgi:hypothetical protein
MNLQKRSYTSGGGLLPVYTGIGNFFKVIASLRHE